jgi:hypothetical protein
MLNFKTPSKTLNKHKEINTGFKGCNPKPTMAFQQTKTAAFTKKPLKKIEKPVLAST